MIIALKRRGHNILFLPNHIFYQPSFNTVLLLSALLQNGRYLTTFMTLRRAKRITKFLLTFCRRNLNMNDFTN